MSADPRVARRSPVPADAAVRATRHLALVGGGAAPLPAARPHWLGALGVVMTLGTVIVAAALAATFFPGLLPALLLS